uniref:Ubiquitin-like-specific protease ESD4 n=1 Tax=Tanacetum cinerariifolium TaxID=118510 RepID=A0A6L2JLB9_TANCI|nr:ubiquitin-like-specific protease ESD4 [Tanacetum cinerariifolium]
MFWECEKMLIRLEQYIVDEVKDKNMEDIDVTSWKKEFVTTFLINRIDVFNFGVFMIKYIDFYSRDIMLCFKQVTNHGEEYDVHVQELGSWSINLNDMSLQDSDTNSYEENSYINVDNVVSKEETPGFQTERMKRSSLSDKSRPPVFEHFKNPKKEPSLRLLEFICNHEGHFVLCGDLNEVYDESLVELPLGVRNFTWMNKAALDIDEEDCVKLLKNRMTSSWRT